MELKNKTILLADDDQEMRKHLCDYLLEQGARVLEADNGKVALKLYQSNRVDAIISDLRMPGGDGVELVQALKALKSKVPCFIITEFSEYTGEELQLLGISAIVFKPYDVEELVSILAQKVK